MKLTPVMSKRTAGLISGVALSFATLPAAAGVEGDPDHLKCYQVKDSLPSGRTVADLYEEFENDLEVGCKVILKARTFCAPVAKLTADEPSGDDSRLDGLGDLLTAQGVAGFMCYPVRCQRRDRTVETIDDQFGVRDVELRDAKTLCTPAVFNGVP